MALSNDARYGRIRAADLVKAGTLPRYTVSTLPPAAANPDRMILVTNGNAGALCAAISVGGAWLRIPLGAAVAAT